MKKTLFVFLQIWALSLNAQPRWIDYQMRSSLFPDDKYLVGFSSQQSRSRSEPEILKDAETAARSELTERVITNIKSVTLSMVENVNASTETYFKKVSSSSSKLSVSGLKTELYFDEKKKVAYCLAYALRQDVVQWYNQESEKNFSLLETKMNLAATKASKQDALKLYLECFAYFPALEENFTIVTALQKAQPFSASKIEEKRQILIERIKSLSEVSPSSISDLASLIASQYKLLISGESKNLMVRPLTYQNTLLASNFSAQLALLFEQKLSQIAEIPVSNPSSALWEFGGTYWTQADQILFQTHIKNVKTGNFVASNEWSIKTSNLDFKGSILPANFEEMLALQKQINEHDPSRNLLVRVTTNKGSEGLVFEEGEKMSLFVTVNQPSYIRAVYFMADQNKILLIDNQYIAENHVGKPYQIAQEFVCAEPFGGELLQVLAQSEPFKPLKTRYYNGYRIIEESTNETLAKSRGFKPVGNSAVKGETSLVITTLPRLR